MSNFSKTIEFIKQQFYNKSVVQLHEPVFFGNEKKYLNDTIESTFVSSVGEYVTKFEKELSILTNTKKAVATVNGTSALQLALKIAGVKSGDEVITQALTFVATANAISYLNAAPLFVDVDIDTYGLSPKALENFLFEYGDLRENGTYNRKTNRKIAACVPMHSFGFMCKIDQIIKICDKWKIPVVEDAAEALGSSYKLKSAGSFGLINSFSFNGNKIITSGGGGAITTNDLTLANKAKYLTTTAKIPHKWNYEHSEIGYNFRMPNLNAALACAQLENFNSIKKSKKNLYEDYRIFFKSEGIKLVDIPKNSEWNYWLMSVVLNNKKERDMFLEETNKNKVYTRPVWELMFNLPMYKNCQRDNQANAMFLQERTVNIPSGSTK